MRYSRRMRLSFSRVLAPLLATAAFAQAPEVREHRCANGFQVLCVERPGAGSFHARIVIRGGRADTGTLPGAAALLLTRTLFGRLLPEEIGPAQGFEALLTQEEGIFEALRLERIRKARQKGGEDSPEALALAQLGAQHLDELRRRVEASASRDPLEALGATRREATSGADAIAFSLDLPIQAFEPWCRLERQHLQRMDLFRFPLERERLMRELGKGELEDEEALSALLGTAFSGHPYAQACDLQRESLEGISWSELRAFARGLCSPDRMTLLLVGDVRLAAAVPVLESTFGALPVIPERPGRQSDRSVELPKAAGYRRLQVSTGGDSHVFMAWRIPAANHPDAPALQVIAQALGAGKGSRLVRKIQEERGLASRLTVRTGVPGGRDPSLLLIEARPSEGHGLAELEESIQGEMLRIQREGFSEEEIRGALRQMEAEALRVQEDAASLARSLGCAVVQSGDWRQAFRAQSLGREFTPEAIQTVARHYLVPAQGITALLGADPLLAPRDLLEEKLGKILTILVQRRLEDPAQAVTVVRETLRQLRMLSVLEREQTLKLLTAQAGS